MNWRQADRYCEDDIISLDTFVLCKLCTTLECEIQDLLVFVPAEKEQERQKRTNVSILSILIFVQGQSVFEKSFPPSYAPFSVIFAPKSSMQPATFRSFGTNHQFWQKQLHEQAEVLAMAVKHASNTFQNDSTVQIRYKLWRY